MDYIDLHTHSHFSDGTLSPTELVALAKETGLRAIALTDHDTTDGIQEAFEAGKKYGVEIIPGIEFSTESSGEAHILGYGIDIHNKELQDTITAANKLRHQNNIRTADALQRLGFDIKMKDIEELSPFGSRGRAHFAKVMVNKGYVSSVKEAFDLYLQKGRPAYNSIRMMLPAEAVGIIKRAGGKAYLAHLHLTGFTGKQLENFVLKLMSAGLDGIEGYYTDYTIDMQKEYQDLAQKYGLKISGGTDFHGQNKPHIRLGVGCGNMKIPYSLVKDIFSTDT